MYILKKKLAQEVVELTLNRPEKRNALTIEMMKELLLELKVQETTRVLLLKGAGSSFCTGLDLDESSDPSTRELAAETIGELLKALYTAPFITIAAVRGHALAGGCGLVAVSDFVLADKDALFGFPEVKRGLVASIVLSFLVRQFGEKELKELFLFGDAIAATRAKEIGLINEITENLEADAEKLALSSLASAPGTVRTLKRLIEHAHPIPIESALQEALSYHKLARSHHESEEGIKAFLEKRKPRWNYF